MAQKQIVSFRRNPDNALKPIAVYGDARKAESRARTRNAHGGDFAATRLLHRLVGAARQDSALTSILTDTAPGLLSAIRGAQGARNPANYTEHFRAFDAEASAIMHRIETSGPSSRRDAGLYTLLAPVYAMQQTLEQMVIDPMLINILPTISLGTPLESGVYMEFVPGIGATEASWEYGTGGAPVAAGTMTPRVVPLKPFKSAVEISGREREVHEAMRGQMGAPAWDLFQKRMEIAMRAAAQRMSDLACYGDPNLGIYGLLSDTSESGITAANVNFDTGTGLTDAATIIAQVATQAAAVGFDPRLVADTIVFDATSWYNLTGRGVSNTGDSDGNVIGRVFSFRPEISEITYALECGPTSAVTTALTPSVGATEAARLRGGYNDSGTTKRCMAIFRNDPEVLAVIEGLPISYEALDDRDGAIRGMIRGSCGGLRAFRKEAIRICYL